MKEHEIISRLPNSDRDDPKFQPSPQTRLDENGEVDTKTVALGQFIPGTGFKMNGLHEIFDSSIPFKYLDTWRDSMRNSTLQPRQIDIIFTLRDLNRWNLAWRGAQICRQKSMGRQVESDNFYPVPLPSFLFRKYQDWPDMDDTFENLPIGLGFGVAGLIYGGLHALAWSAHFQSSIEQSLWRISACIVMGGIPILLLLFHAWERIDGTTVFHTWGYLIDDIIRQFFGLSMIIVFVAYALARAYLVVECFINLSQLPAGVYDMPNWSAYFPHIA